MDAELKECPFCGSEAKLDDCRTAWAVRCTSLTCWACVIGERAPEPEDGDEYPAGYWERFEQTAVDRWNSRAIAPPVAAQGGKLQESLVSLYRYKALPRTVTPGGPIMATITEVFESENDNTRIIIESSMGGASLRAEKLSAPVAAGSVDTPEFQALVFAYRRGSKHSDYIGLLNHLDAWGAQQREAGRVDALQRFDPQERYGEPAMAEVEEGDYVLHADAIAWGAEQREAGRQEGIKTHEAAYQLVIDAARLAAERAEKAEAHVKELEDWILSLPDNWRETAYKSGVVHNRHDIFSINVESYIDVTEIAVSKTGLYSQK